MSFIDLFFLVIIGFSDGFERETEQYPFKTMDECMVAWSSARSTLAQNKAPDDETTVIVFCRKATTDDL